MIPKKSDANEWKERTSSYFFWILELSEESGK